MSLLEFLVPGIATSIACFFTHPVETVKVRLQLQNQLQSTTSQGNKNSRALILSSIKNEGILSLQRGLSAGIAYQFVMNGARLGSYSSLQKYFGQMDLKGPYFFIGNFVLGAGSGMFGAFLGSPFFMAKTRMQSAMLSLTPEQLANAGHQYRYKNVVEAIATIYKNEGGILALWRGSSVACWRVAIGSAAQLASYDSCKRFVVDNLGFDPKLTRTHLLASVLTGLIATTFMNPFDVVSTRMYNQSNSKGDKVLYTSVFDCIKKIITKEGPYGFYKGFTAHYARLAPHTILTFVFWEFLKGKLL